ncbi:DUF1330 domain-containing protein [Catalinimonas alkaloidigena]|uniref:DUF1330 domain-containing protein n=1 Tax=Catalinimonas alkaloidigena TaxID=1075417 RepID=UPI002404E1D1|nr:DUF1330 domain-containing protein [Catalinimonas alkaloidigena]
MIYFTQFIYLKEGQEDVFHAFEDVAIPIIRKHKGELLLRLRPTQDTVIDATIEKPYEIHLVSFFSEADFESFKLDKTRKQLLHLKEQSIRELCLIQGHKL